MNKNRRIAMIVGFVFTAALATHFMTVSSMTQDPVMPDRYCVELRDGKTVLIQDNKPVTSEVALNDGSKVTSAAVIIRKDGTVVQLKTGDCIDKEGNVNNMSPAVSPIRK